MKKIDLGQSISIAANLGVIAGIVFLAIEIGQTNDQLAAQSRNTMYQLREKIASDYVNNVGDIADLIAKERRGDALTEVEAGRLNARRVQMLRSMEYMVQEAPEDSLYHAQYMTVLFSTNFGLAENFLQAAAGGSYDPLFVSFIEQNVLPGLDD